MEKGIVKKLVNKEKKIYLIKIIEEDEKESCHKCPINRMCHKNDREVIAYSEKELKIDQEVNINITEKNEAKAFSSLFLIPLIISITLSGITGILISNDLIIGLVFIVSLIMTIIINSRIIRDKYIARIE
ncbi:MAG TPA: SoxR reducing system RseC family protein [Spirochaetota bacterium]|nr:SoxR reducing system RseC family protein [Spirochaetota bacterium]HOM38893.1 SoxR reducing system RseC family protein [Spirochaetota bacterium]HPQ49128.1 SoxR reducing system RseC family protein [Spirochaetota bacterium]